MKRIFYIFFLISLQFTLSASDTLTIVQFEDIVLQNHPLIQSAELYNEIAKSYLKKGRGVLDPKLYSNYDGKNFKGKNYYRRWTTELKVPTKYPIDLAFGYENNSGEYLNSENYLPSNGMIYGTISISLLRGLLFNEERLELKKSKLLADKSKVEKELIIRRLIIEGRNVYTDWSMAFSEYNIVTSYYDRVAERHQFVIQLFENGDKPAIDTIESRINLNTALKAKIDALSNLIMKRQKINMFLWGSDGEPLELLENVVPQNISRVTELLKVVSLGNSQDWFKDPFIRKKQIEIEHIQLENRLEREQLKPLLNVKLNTLHSLGDNTLAYSYNINDYKLGASLILPIINRKSRGQIQLNETIIEQNTLELEYYKFELQNRFNTLLSTYVLIQKSLNVSLEKVENSQLLYNAEQLKFELGESSVFLLNSRERKLLEAEKEYLKILKTINLINNEMYFLQLGQEK